jgi:predicted adenine nucleotide alpha hydrolase (AANH) superfamily ATPase
VAENYQKQLDEVIGTLDMEKSRKKLLLHVCCAPCASYVLEYITGYFDITVFFFNPNIYPPEEYKKRLEELEKLLDKMPLKGEVSLSIGEYEPPQFDRAVKGLEEQREGGDRCRACIGMRLEETAKVAASKGFDYFCTTLSISPYKNARMINEGGGELAQKYGVRFLPSDFKKRDGYKRSIELCAMYDIYRQNYCGCRYSIRNNGG